ncbi:MAG: MarR family transcriptional regulator [Chloroflexota bacterium]
MSEDTIKQEQEKWLTFVTNLNPNIDPHAMRLMDEMRRTAHAIFRMGESSISAAGLSYAKYRLLMRLHFSETVEGREGLSPSELSDHQGTSRNTISSLIRNLEEDGYIERHLNKKDRRKFNICLTTAGRALFREHASRHLDEINGCFGSLNAEEQATFSRLLHKVRENIDADSKE